MKRTLLLPQATPPATAAVARLLLIAACAAQLIIAVAGCGQPKTSVTKSESQMIHAPLGQPMPPEARAAMEKANQQRTAGTAAPAPAPK